MPAVLIDRSRFPDADRLTPRSIPAGTFASAHQNHRCAPSICGKTARLPYSGFASIGPSAGVYRVYPWDVSATPAQNQSSEGT